MHPHTGHIRTVLAHVVHFLAAYTEVGKVPLKSNTDEAISDDLFWK